MRITRAIGFLFLLSACAVGDLTTPERSASLVDGSIVVIAGADQIGLPGAKLAKLIKFEVRDGGVPVANVRGTIAVTAGGGGVSKTTFRTNASGGASFDWTLGTTGAQTVLISLNEGGITKTVSAVVISTSSTLTVTNGNNQTGLPGDTLPNTIRLRFTAPGGAPLGNVNVNFAIDDGSGGGVRFATLKTNLDGRVTNYWALGWNKVNQQLTASVPGVASVNVSATANTTGMTFEILSGNNQSGLANGDLAPIVGVLKKNGVVFQGARGTIEVLSGGGSLSRTTFTTNVTGRGTATWTLGFAQGSQQVKMTIGAVGSVTFDATATTGYEFRNLSAISRNHVMSRHVTNARTIELSYEFQNSMPSGATTAVFLAPRVHTDYYTPSGGQVYCYSGSPLAGYGQTHTVNCTITVPFAMPAGTYDLFYTIYAPGTLSGFVTFKTVRDAVTVDDTNPLTIDSVSVSPNSFPPFTVDKMVTARMGASSSQGIVSISASLYSGVSHLQSCNMFNDAGSTIPSLSGGCVLNFLYSPGSYDIRYIARDQAGNVVEQWMMNAVTVN